MCLRRRSADQPSARRPSRDRVRTRSDSVSRSASLSGPFDVRRQRHVSERIDRCVQIDRALGRRAARAAGRRNGAPALRHGCERRARGPHLSNSMRLPGFSFCPGCTSACQSRAVLTLEQQALDAPPLGSRWPISRAGNTRVSLATSRSPGVSNDGSAEIVDLPPHRPRRDRPRAGAPCRGDAVPARSDRREDRNRSRDTSIERTIIAGRARSREITRVQMSPACESGQARRIRSAQRVRVTAAE